MTQYIIITTTNDGYSCTHLFDDINEFKEGLEIMEELFYKDKFIELKTIIETEYERYPVD